MSGCPGALRPMRRPSTGKQHLSSAKALKSSQSSAAPQTWDVLFQGGGFVCTPVGFSQSGNFLGIACAFQCFVGKCELNLCWVLCNFSVLQVLLLIFCVPENDCGFFPLLTDISKLLKTCMASKLL